VYKKKSNINVITLGKKKKIAQAVDKNTFYSDEYLMTGYNRSLVVSWVSVAADRNIAISVILQHHALRHGCDAKVNKFHKVACVFAQKS